jgi:predicted metal-dependent phosphoesterase TrpH
MLKKLADLGISITLPEVEDMAGPGQIGRPHIARALIAKGVVSTMDEAFDTLLGKNRPAYVDKYRITCEDAIRLIRKAGGIPVLAHPGIVKTSAENDLKTLVSVLQEMGLMGIEVYYPDHTEAQIELYLRLAREKDLLITGGTDFHGAMHHEIQMGSGRGNTFVPYSVYEALIQRLA